jgi:hypothetical protein
MNSDYPQPVQDFAKKMTEAVRDLLGDEIGEQEFESCCLEACLERWLKGEDMIDLIEEDRLEKILNDALLETVCNSLRRKGIIDSIEDENGKDILFLTSLGKKIKENIQNK